MSATGSPLISQVHSSRRSLVVFALAVVTTIAVFSAPGRALDPDSDKLATATVLIRRGNLDKAEAVLWDILARQPDNPQGLNLLGSIRLQQKRFAESETLLHRAITLSPHLVSAYINLARLYHAQSEPDKEIEMLLNAASLDPKNSDVNCGLAAAYLKQSNFQLALEAIKRIPAVHLPDNALPLLAASYLGLDRGADVRSLMPVLAARAVKNPALRVEFAEVLLDFGLSDDALTILEIAQKQQPPTAELYFALGRAREVKGELTSAEKDFRRAVALDPNSVAAMQALARSLALQGHWDKAAELLSRARRADPDSPDILRKFAAASLHAGKTADAVDASQQLLKLRPKESEALYLLGVAQLQNGDAEQARGTLQRYVNLRNNDPLALLALGMADANLRDFAAAQPEFEQSLKLDPNQADAYYQLALVFREQGDNPAAISQLEKAVAVDHGRAQLHALLGTLYLLNRDYAHAQEHLTRAEQLAPNSPDTHYQLGLLFARLNQPDRAQQEMAQFRKLKDKEHPGPVPPGESPPKSLPPFPPS